MADPTEKLLAAELSATLRDCRLARELVVLEETTSTNDIVAERARAGAAEGLVVFAERQTAGRGRQGRPWDSAPHQGLWFSILFRPSLPLGQWARLTTWAALAIAEALDPFTPESGAIKWPNDILFDGRKAVGILTELSTDQAQASFAVMGIGVNVNQTEFPPELSGKAVSLRMLAGRSQDRGHIAAAILRRLDDRYPDLSQDFAGIIREVARRSCTLGRQVTIGDLSGVAESMNENGALLIRTDEGESVIVSSGEVSVQRVEREA